MFQTAVMLYVQVSTSQLYIFGGSYGGFLNGMTHLDKNLT
jgi:dipeptidyl aminopeptidase/acylaminoacyl peptidase